MNTIIRPLIIAASFAFAAFVMPAVADDASDFADDASAKSLAEVQTGRLALEKSRSADVKVFAQKMIDDHTKANQELANVAKNAKVTLSDEAALMDKAKKLILEQRDGEDFDAAYANNQVMAHEKTIDLFEDYLREGKNTYLKAFATETLPKLKHHLEMAKELKAKHPEPK